MEIKFENLIYDTENTLTDLCDFLELEFHASSMLDVDLSRHNIGRHQSDLSSEQIKQVERVFRSWMIEKGYMD